MAGDGLCEVDVKVDLKALSVPVTVCAISALGADLSEVYSFLGKL